MNSIKNKFGIFAKIVAPVAVAVAIFAMANIATAQQQLVEAEYECKILDAHVTPANASIAPIADLGNKAGGVVTIQITTEHCRDVNFLITPIVEITHDKHAIIPNSVPENTTIGPGFSKPNNDTGIIYTVSKEKETASIEFFAYIYRLSFTTFIKDYKNIKFLITELGNSATANPTPLEILMYTEGWITPSVKLRCDECEQYANYVGAGLSGEYVGDIEKMEISGSVPDGVNPEALKSQFRKASAYDISGSEGAVLGVENGVGEIRDLCNTDKVRAYMEQYGINPDNRLNCYNSLAPLPFINIKSDLNKDGVPDFHLINMDIDGDGIYDTQVYIGQIYIGYYINMLFQFLIGLAGLIAVIALMYAGVVYMTSGNPLTKSKYKTRIINIFFGLIILLGMTIVLNTINPRILNIVPGKIVYGAGVDGIGLTNGGPMKVYLDSEDTYTTVQQACDKSATTYVNMFGKNVRVHGLLVEKLKKVEQEVLAYQEEHNTNYQINDMGGYKCRTIKRPDGSDTGQYSSHSYGLSLDINHEANPHVGASEEMQSDMPEWFIDIWVNNGFGWGGDWETSKDPMHFSMYCVEQVQSMKKRRNINISC